MGESEGTHRRLAALLAVAAVAGGVAVFVGNATAGKTVVRPVHEPKPLYSQVTQSCPVPQELRPAFARAARDTALPLSMLVAVGKVESNLEVDARSVAGARGLLQLMPATAAALQLNVDDPSANVLAGARYLRQMLNQFSSTDLALAAYNAGPTAVHDAGGFPSRGVETYVANVNELWRSLAGCL
ncbi:MAG TPA: transglycosylase SLT domain-containing protein [Gaiellaceae bacterium]|nr:transglycosylase SLT domain-containing protein [Gaiellaceae bacterium]